ncbi:LysE family translocator [Gammaproteobacteria bacterium]|nr:LysE family translocator [Gammaproteobacteria bacterium]
MSPGPSLIVVSQNTLIGGLRAGVLTAVSHGTGVCFYAFLTVFGVALMTQNSQIIVSAIRIFGCIFLLYLAWNVYHVKWKFDLQSSGDKTIGSSLEALRDGFMTAIINPKIILFFTALFGQFIGEDTLVFTKFNLVLIATLVDMIWYIIVALSLSKSRLAVLHGKEHFLTKSFSLMLIAFAIYFFIDIVFIDLI